MGDSQALAAWRATGLIHGDIKPSNIVVEWLVTAGLSDSDVNFCRVLTYLIDVEGIVEMPRALKSIPGGMVEAKSLCACASGPICAVVSSRCRTRCFHESLRVGGSQCRAAVCVE